MTQIIENIKSAINEVNDLRDAGLWLDDEGNRTDDAQTALDNLGAAYAQALPILGNAGLLRRNSTSDLPSVWEDVDGYRLRDDDELYNAEVCLSLLNQLLASN